MPPTSKHNHYDAVYHLYLIAKIYFLIFLNLLVLSPYLIRISYKTCLNISLHELNFQFCFRNFVISEFNFLSGMGNPSQEEWEERILHLSMDVLSESMLGIRLSGHSFLQWRFEVLKEEK